MRATPSPRITIRYGCVSLLKHRSADLCNASVPNLCGVAHSGAGRERERRPRTLRCGPGARTCARRASTPRPARARSRSASAPRSGLRGVGVGRGVPSASVVKAMLLVAYLREPDVRGRRLRAAERALLGPDDPPLRQRRGVAGVQHRGHRRARPPRAPRPHAALPRHPPLGPLDDQRRGPDALLPPHRPPRAEAPPPLRDAAARLDRARPAMGDRPRAPDRAGRSTSRAAGARAPAGRTTRWPYCAAEGAASRWRS